MLAALATLAFLATIWLIAAVALHMLGDSGGKIVAALKGQSLLATARPVQPVAVRVTQRSRLQPVLRAEPRLRAAA